MSTGPLVATGITQLLTCYDSCMHRMSEYYKLICKTNDICKKIFDSCTCDQGNKYIKLQKPIYDIYIILSKYSLIELKEYLKLLIPIASALTHPNLISAINTIDNEIEGLTDDNKNFNDLINVNQKLKNENEELRGELNAIKKIITKT